MKIWVDADSCPVVIKEIIFKAANRTETQVTLVANHNIAIPPSRFIDFLQVGQGFDVADNEIVQRLNPGDLVITSDIPLADEIITKGGHALSARGELFTTENIKPRLNMRDFMESMRSSGIQTGGQAPLNKADRMAFANHLDRWLTQCKKSI